MIDSRLVVLYVSTLYEKLKELDPKKVSMLIYFHGNTKLSTMKRNPFTEHLQMTQGLKYS